ncbi:MAG: pyruvate kinase [Phycisphaeraceae bacterium]|nr:pyruvate kinase [Phycisphaeraceae bacterium]
MHPANRPSARNLLHYLALRQDDMRPLQRRLARAGLSSLGRTEAHVLVSLDRTLGMLALALGEAPAEEEEGAVPVGFRHGEALLARNAERLLGPPDVRRRVRIMVTLPSEAADEPDLVRDMVAAGMNCARINCAHDEPDVWGRMAAHVAAARRELGTPCRIFMDLAGPKLRTGPLRGGEAFVRVHAGETLTVVAPGAAPEAESTGVVIECRCERGHVSQSIGHQHEHHCDAEGPAPAEHDHRDDVPCDDALVVMDQATRPDQPLDEAVATAEVFEPVFVDVQRRPDLLLNVSSQTDGPPGGMTAVLRSTVLRT